MPTMIPNIFECVKPVRMPDAKKQEILGRVVGQVSPKTREVLENGGFSFAGRDSKGRDIFKYTRLSRDGQPLRGGEAQSEPCYELSVRGQCAFRCACPACTKSIVRGDGAKCKHIDALDLWLSDTPWMEAA